MKRKVIAFCISAVMIAATVSVSFAEEIVTDAVSDDSITVDDQYKEQPSEDMFEDAADANEEILSDVDITVEDTINATEIQEDPAENDEEIYYEDENIIIDDYNQEEENEVVINSVQVEVLYDICEETHGNYEGGTYKYTDYNFLNEKTNQYNLIYTVDYTEDDVNQIFTGNADEIYGEFGSYPELVELGPLDEAGKITVTEKLEDVIYSFDIRIVAHNVVTDAAVEATCTNTGLTEGSHCSECGKIIEAQDVIPVREHTIVIDEAVSATIDSTGLTEGSHCDVCGKIIVEQYVIPELSEEGWHVIGNDVYYYKDGKVYTGWFWDQENECWYYFSPESGIMLTGWQEINDSWYYFSDWGGMLTGWQEINNSWYYFSDWGGMLTGWQEINDKWYYFSDWGGMLTGWQEINDSWYYFSDWGRMLTGWQEINDSWYCFSDGGRMLTGWQEINDKWYCFSDGGRMLIGWQEINDKWYCFSDWGGMLTGWQEINDSWYYFSDWGGMYAGWMKYNDNWYYFSDWGDMVTGWWLVDDTWYYFDNAGKMVSNKTLILNGTSYTFNSDGTVKSGWRKINGKYSYMQDNATLAKGWFYDEDEGEWYYLDSDGIMQTGWIYVDDDWYYLNTDGSRCENWHKISGYYYYFDDDGVMQEGLIRDEEGYYYYLYPGSGRMATYTNLTIDGEDYYFDYYGYGIKVTNGTDAAMTIKAQNYWSSTDYLIMVNCSTDRMGIYKWNYTNKCWDLYRFWACTTGAVSTKTVKGVFKIYTKGYTFDADDCTCYYYSAFYGGYYIHSILYNYHTWSVMDARLGMDLSHGCVRLSTNYAYWVYCNVPIGTTVVTY